MRKSEMKQEHIERINFAVTKALDHKDWEPESLLSGGLTGVPVYKIKVRDKSYAIKLENINDKNFDLVRNYEIVEAVSKQGISPRVFYTNPEQGIILMECINSSFQPAIASPYLEKLAAVARKLHKMELFKEWKSLREILDHSINKLPPQYLKNSYIHACLQEIKKLEEIIFFQTDIRSSHGDFHIANTLFDGDRYLLVDWQAAAPRSFYFDLSCYATFMFSSNAKCNEFLQAYLEREPKEEEIAKYNLMRIFTNIYYGIGFIAISLEGGKDLPLMSDENISKLPHHCIVLQAVAAALNDSMNKQKFGFACLKSSLEAIADEKYRKAFEQVSVLKQSGSKHEAPFSELTEEKEKPPSCRKF